MKITMLKTAPGSVDGIRVATFEVGIEYDLTATDGTRELAAAFVGAGMAEPVGEVVERPDAEMLERAGGQEAAPARAKPGRKPKQ